MTTQSSVNGIQMVQMPMLCRRKTFSPIMKLCFDLMLLTWNEVMLLAIHLHRVLLTWAITGSKIAGHRGFFLTNDGIDLNQAMINYGLDFLRRRSYKKIQPPFFMRKDMMSKTAQLDQFDEELYKVRFNAVSLQSKV
jgi:hypothetical protein